MKGDWNRPSINIEPALHQVAVDHARKDRDQSFAAYVTSLLKADLKKAGKWPITQPDPVLMTQKAKRTLRAHRA